MFRLCVNAACFAPRGCLVFLPCIRLPLRLPVLQKIWTPPTLPADHEHEETRPQKGQLLALSQHSGAPSNQAVAVRLSCPLNKDDPPTARRHCAPVPLFVPFRAQLEQRSAMLSALLAFLAGFVLCSLLVPSVRATLFALDDSLDAHELAVSKVSARELPYLFLSRHPVPAAQVSVPVSERSHFGLLGSPFRETGPPACMAQLIMLRHKVRTGLLPFYNRQIDRDPRPRSLAEPEWPPSTPKHVPRTANLPLARARCASHTRQCLVADWPGHEQAGVLTRRLLVVWAIILYFPRGGCIRSL